MNGEKESMCRVLGENNGSNEKLSENLRFATRIVNSEKPVYFKEAML
jgi:hypothetical protein